jgi:DNA (cytosine-5)-methyltransferase 1
VKTETKQTKPPYRVPTMAEVQAVPLTGRNVASLFSGAGGSSLGYRMAGFKVVWANEFVEAARDCYRANFPETTLDPRDIRTITPEEVLEALGMKPGELDVLDGSPPCAAFSTAGKREKSWNKVKAYSDTHQRTDDLFFEYARLLKGVQPKVFVAENVSGLVKGTAKGYFLEILKELKGCGYVVQARVLDAQWLGVPQMRQRLFFVGVREDLDRKPAFPKPLPYRYSVRDALPGIVRQGDNGGFGGGAMREAIGPSPTIGTGPSAGNGRFPPSLVEVTRVIHDTSGQWAQNRDVTDRPCPAITVGGLVSNACHFQVETDISRYAIGAEWDRLKPGEQSERYFQLVRSDPEAPCQTVTAAGGSGSIAAVTHPTERRKFTIAELKAICAFPPDFILTGSYPQQWERLGRAVPPIMMQAVARSVADLLEDR